MRLEFKQSFERSFHQLSEGQQHQVLEAVERLRAVYETQQVQPGLGLKLLKTESRIWEMRAGIELRVVFRVKGDLIEFAFVGTHDRLRRHLRDL